jgi:chorismate synthase
LIVCQDEIIVEINGHHESNENSDIEMDINNDSMQDDEDDESANSEQKLLKASNNNNDFIAVKIHPEVKNLHNGVGVNGFDELCLKINQMGW